MECISTRTGNLIACADEHNELWSIAPDKKVTVLVKDFQGKYLNGPNDVWVAPNGAMYITDPFYKRKWWDHSTMALTNEEVFYLSPDRKKLTRVTDDLKKPNGITGTPDGKTLFVADIEADQTWRYDILPDGSLTNKTLFCAKGSDGMTIDEEGDLYLCGHGVTVFDKTGKQIEHIDVHGTVDGQRQFRRQGPQNTFYHRQQIALFDSTECQRRESGEVKRVMGRFVLRWIPVQPAGDSDWTRERTSKSAR